MPGSSPLPRASSHLRSGEAGRLVRTWGSHTENPWRGLKYDEVGRQFFLEQYGRAPHLRFYRAQRHPGARGDLVVAEVLVAAQDKHLTASSRQLGDRARDGISK